MRFICLYKNLQDNFFTLILIFIGYYLYIFIQVKFSVCAVFIVTLIHHSSELPLHYWSEALHRQLTTTGAMVCLSLGLRPVSTEEKRWDVAKGHSLLTGQKTPQADCTIDAHLFPYLREVCCLFGVQVRDMVGNPPALAQPLDYCSLLGFSGRQ